jgi:outer membrane protein TolC
MKQLMLLAFFFTSSIAIGQLTFRSLDELFAYADSHAVEILNAQAQTQLNTSRSRAAQTALLPSIKASAGFNDNITLQPTLVPATLFNPSAPEGSFNEMKFGRKYVYSSGIQAFWEVVNFQKWFDIQVAKAGSSLGEAQVVRARYEVYNQLAQTYYSILLTEKYLHISADNVRIADSINRIARDKYETGVFSEENLNRSKIQQIEAERQLNGLKASLQQLNNQLQSQLNVNETILLKEGLAYQTLEGCDELVSGSSHPEVAIQEAQVILSGKIVSQTKSLLYPTLTLGYQYNLNWATDRVFDFSQSNHLPQQFWGIKLSIPVFNGFAVREKINQSRIQLQQQQTILNAKKIQAQKEDDNLRIQWKQNLDELKGQEEVLALQVQNDVHTENRYQSGVIGLDERLDKFQDLLQAQNQYMQSLSNYYISHYKLYIRKLF